LQLAWARRFEVYGIARVKKRFAHGANAHLSRKKKRGEDGTRLGADFERRNGDQKEKG
jgi:hypothetical protein